MKVIEIWTRPNSSDVLTRQPTRIHKGQYHKHKHHDMVDDSDITRERFDQLVKEKGFTLLNTIVI